MIKNKVRIFFDESGSISKKQNKLFVVTCVIPQNSKKLNNKFKRWKIKYSERNQLNPKDEVKGSSMSDEDLMFFIKLMSPLVKVVYCWFRSEDLKNQSWLENTKLTHNYLIWLATEKALEIKEHNNANITMEIDIMNNPSKGMNSLEDYINTQLIYEKTGNNETNVHYINSQDSWAIQCVDIFCHFIYRKLKGDEKSVLDKNIAFFERKIH